ncbi:hypothetical protein [Methylomagnum sp.]
MLTDVFRWNAEILRREIEHDLDSVGILSRVFGRGKSDYSINKKLSKEPEKYSIEGKLIQDAIGIRVVIYFQEDIEIVKTFLCSKYAFDPESSTIDTPSASTFSVTRYNLIFKIPSHLQSDVGRALKGVPIDLTFEVQIRSILSEGWHEVEHDLRYKCPSHWIGCDESSRALNGVVATLETAEWSMRKIFDELAYRHYKAKNWAAMLHTNLRMRLAPSLSESIVDVLNADAAVAKELSRISKAQVIRNLMLLEVPIPLNLDNMVFLWNFISAQHAPLEELTPEYVRESFDRYLGSS